VWRLVGSASDRCYTARPTSQKEELLARDRIQLQVPFAQIPRWIIESPNLSDRAVRLYGVLHRWAGLPDGIVPGRKRLSVALRGCSVSSVDRAVKELVAVGAMTVERRWDDAGDPTSNFYTLIQYPGGSRTSEDTPTAGEATGSRVGDEQEIPNLNDTKLVTFPKEEREQMFAAFVEEFGKPTRPMRGAYGLTVNDALDAGVRPDHIGPAARRYRDRWPKAACTPMALIKHWNTFGPQPPRIVAEEPEEIIEPADPSLVRSLVEGFRG